MGYSRSTYFAYGVHVTTENHAWHEADHADTELPKIKDDCPDVRHFQAGDYDADWFFLVTKSREVELGQFEHITPQTVTPEQSADWDRQLIAAAMALGYRDISAPGWFVIPDCS